MYFKKCEKFIPGAYLLLRLVLGVTFFIHGALKLGWFGGPGIAGVTGFVGSLGFAPAVLWAWVLALVEFVGGILLIVGLLTSLAAWLLAIDMALATILVHLPNGFIAIPNGGFEFSLILLAVALFFAVAGAGKLSLDAVIIDRKKSEPAIIPNS